MKLNKYLTSLVGQTLTAEHVSTISVEIDGIRDRAVAKETEKFTDLQKKFEKTSTELEGIKESAQDVELKTKFVEAGGNPEKFESFKKVAGKIEKLEDYNFEETLTEFPSLVGEAGVKENPFDAVNNIHNVKTPEPTGNLPEGFVDSTVA